MTLYEFEEICFCIRLQFWFIMLLCNCIDLFVCHIIPYSHRGRVSRRLVVSGAISQIYAVKSMTENLVNVPFLFPPGNSSVSTETQSHHSRTLLQNLQHETLETEYLTLAATHFMNTYKTSYVCTVKLDEESLLPPSSFHYAHVYFAFEKIPSPLCDYSHQVVRLRVIYISNRFFNWGQVEA